jgi:hypothetical protein
MTELQVAPLHLFWITLDDNDNDDNMAGSPAHPCVTSHSCTSSSQLTSNTFQSMAEWQLQLVDEDETDHMPVRQSAISTTLIQAPFNFN